MLHFLAKHMGLRVLAFTLDNWFISAHARRNIVATLEHLDGVDHMFFRPSWAMTQKLFRGGFSLTPDSPLGQQAFLVGHACLPCFAMLTYFSARTAIDQGIVNVVIGTTPGQMSQRTLNDLTKRFRSADEAVRSLAAPFLEWMSASAPELSQALRLSWLQKLKASRLNLVPFYDFVRYDERRILETITAELNWERPRDTDSCSTNCTVNALGIHVHKQRYGISPYTIPLAADVRSGLLSRDEALRQVTDDVDMHQVRSAAERVGIALAGPTSDAQTQ